VCQGIDECALVVLAQLDDVSRFERADRRLVNAADDEVCERHATQSRRFLEQPLLFRADACLETLGSAVGSCRHGTLRSLCTAICRIWQPSPLRSTPNVWATLNSAVSRPFPVPTSGRIGVKVIIHLDDEVMKVFRVE
jgi:hypothetical protein